MVLLVVVSCHHFSVEYRPAVEMHCHKLTVLYRKSLRAQLMPHLHSSLKQAGLSATVIEGGAGETSVRLTAPRLDFMHPQQPNCC